MTQREGGLYRCWPRHWFAYYGQMGSSSPVCVRCGAPNPRYDRQRDPKAREQTF